MGCEWNNGNCRGGFGTRPYHPHNCNGNGPPYRPHNCNGNGPPYRPHNCNGMVPPTTRPYHPHNCNRNGPPYESATTMTTGIVPPSDTASAIAPTGHGAPYPDSVEHTRNVNHALRPQ